MIHTSRTNNSNYNLAILGTIAYISFQGYTKDARDGLRISDIKQIYNGLSIYKVQTEKTLLPDNYIGSSPVKS